MNRRTHKINKLLSLSAPAAPLFGLNLLMLRNCVCNGKETDFEAAV